MTNDALRDSILETSSAPQGAAEPPSTRCFIDGAWVEGENSFSVMDKFTGVTLADVSSASRVQVGQAVEAAEHTFAEGVTPPVERARWLWQAAKLLQSRRNQFLEVMVAESGFTITDVNAEINRSLVTLTLSAEEATRIVGETVALAGTPGQHERLGFTMRVPLGVVCAITPFNAPLNVVLHKIAPALAAGNVVVLKPSAFTPLTAALLCQLLLDAGVPPGFLSLVQGPGNTVGTWLLERPEIAFYSFTGSTEVGRIIQQAAGLRRTQLELGSIASTIVCSDADLDCAMPKIANASFRKAGQVCTSIQRLYVEQSVVSEVIDRLLHLVHAMPVGNPRESLTHVGPMISEEAAKRAQTWITEAIAGHVRVISGGERDGAILQPTILTNVRNGMKVFDQEIFAPVVSIIPFDDLEHAVQDANATPFGLAAGIFTRDLRRAMAAARTLRFGGIHINETSSSRVDGMPYGGVKESGLGHEGPKYAIRDLTEERLITITS